MGRIRTVGRSRGSGRGRGLAEREEDEGGRSSVLEDRPSKLSHALSVLRKRRFGVAMLGRGVSRKKGGGGEGGREGAEIGRRKEVTEEDRGRKERSYPEVDYRETEKRAGAGETERKSGRAREREMEGKR